MSKQKIRVAVAIVFVVLLLLELQKIRVDMYNFKQLEIAMPVLDTLPADARGFFTVKEFNTRYKQDIQPIKNCYYISNANGNEPYIFGFKLESTTYKLLYGVTDYAYPRYAMPYSEICYGVCDDRNMIDFKYAISHSCAAYYRMIGR